MTKRSTAKPAAPTAIDPPPDATNIQGAIDAEKPVDAPNAVLGALVQEQHGGDDAVGNVELATGVIDAGGHPEGTDRDIVLQAVADLSDQPGPIIPPVSILGFPKALEITGPKKGRRRAGRDFGRDPVRIPFAELTEEDLKALSEDPSLTIVPVFEA